MKLKWILALPLLPSLQAGQFELLRCYVHLLHKTAKHKINQVLVFLMYLSYIRILLINRHIRIEYYNKMQLQNLRRPNDCVAYPGTSVR